MESEADATVALRVHSPLICTCLAGYDVKATAKAVAHCAMAEIRLDTMSIEKDQIPSLFTCASVPVIATCRPSEHLPDETRFDCLATAIAAGCAYVDIEIDAPYLKDLLAMTKTTHCKTILSYHHYAHTPPKAALRSILATMQQLQPDYCKIVTRANTALDAQPILSLYEQHTQLLAFCMGHAGRLSRITSYLLGAPFIYAAPDNGIPTADGQFTVSQIRQLFQVLHNH